MSSDTESLVVGGESRPSEESGPLVSIVVAAYNAGEYLRRSLASALAQTYQNIEILLADDGSDDGSIEAVEDLIGDPRVRLLRQPRNMKKPAALNRALSELRGDYYALQDADDESHPTRIERQVAAFQADPTLAAVFVRHRLIIDGRRIAPTYGARDTASCRRAIEAFLPPALDPTAMYRVEKVRDLRYDEGLPVGQGIDYILQVGERHPMIVLGECLYDYRVLRPSLTRTSTGRVVQVEQKVAARAAARRGVPAPAHQGRPGRSDNNIAAHFMESTLDLRRAGRRADSLRTAVACARLRPRDPHHYKALVYAVVPELTLPVIRRRARRPGAR